MRKFKGRQKKQKMERKNGEMWTTLKHFLLAFHLSLFIPFIFWPFHSIQWNEKGKTWMAALYYMQTVVNKVKLVQVVCALHFSYHFLWNIVIPNKSAHIFAHRRFNHFAFSFASSTRCCYCTSLNVILIFWIDKKNR